MPKLGIPATRMNRCKNRALTFDMSGGPKGAKRPLERPLDGGVRPRCSGTESGKVHGPPGGLEGRGTALAPTAPVA